jgi:predicted lipoprotein with Yx(FWY)xxD motif
MQRFFLGLALTLLSACGHGPGSASIVASDNPSAGNAAAGVQVVQTGAGAVFADMQGLSLYTYDHDTISASTCYNACANAWPPLLTTATTLTAPFGVTTRTDGTTQVTYDDHPLYRYAGDGAEGDINGDGVDGIWHLAKP